MRGILRDYHEKTILICKTAGGGGEYTETNIIFSKTAGGGGEYSETTIKNNTYLVKWQV